MSTMQPGKAGKTLLIVEDEALVAITLRTKFSI
jgi:hypothetical protein